MPATFMAERQHLLQKRQLGERKTLSAAGGRRRATSTSNRTELGLAALGAIEPLVELFLELGITSPEAESLWRGVFVHKARSWLMGSEGGEPPSDVQVALVSGVHRNFVRRLLAEPPKIAAVRERKGHRAARLLEAWHRDPAYLDSSGKPRDLPERGRPPSFEALVNAQAPGIPSRAVLRELNRAGVVELLADRRVRVRSRNMRVPGVSAANLKEVGKRSAEYLRTLIHNLREPRDDWLNERLVGMEISRSRMPIVREVIYRRTVAFLHSLELELMAERKRLNGRDTRVARLSVTAFGSFEM